MQDPSNNKFKPSFFSVPFELVKVGISLPFDIYINSSSLVSREKFVRVFPMGGILEEKDLIEFKTKYFQIYVSEKQRQLYLSSLINNEQLNTVQKTTVIKDVAIHYLSKLFDHEKVFNTELLKDTVSGCRDAVESMVNVIQDYSIDEIQKLIGDLSFHDFYTYDHSINVAMYSMALYRAYNPKASKEELIASGMGGLLHDLGKIKIPTEIINNPDKLDDEQFKQIMQHPIYGLELLDEKICSACQGVDFETIKRVVYEHHENFDGSGYPNKVKGEDIHVMARVTAIADFFDAITTKRSYNEVLSPEDALAVMLKSSGKKIDPELFTIFTTKVKNLVFKGKGNIELPEDFDPCQPHRVLPFQKVTATKKNINLFEKNADYGKVVKESEDVEKMLGEKKKPDKKKEKKAS